MCEQVSAARLPHPPLVPLLQETAKVHNRACTAQGFLCLGRTSVPKHSPERPWQDVRFNGGALHIPNVFVRLYVVEITMPTPYFSLTPKHEPPAAARDRSTELGGPLATSITDIPLA